MRITLSAPGARYYSFLAASAGFATAGAYLYSMSSNRIMAICLGAFAMMSLLAFALITKMKPYLHLDENGVFDARLGVGKISWSDVEDVSFVSSYGNRFLCLKIRDHQEYVQNLIGPQKENRLFHESLGFKTFNVEIGDLEISLLDLKKLAETYIRQSRQRQSGERSQFSLTN